jgi:2-keto-4-pentenoate hydratase/2-oxohepta-3-ene-1,7-dioic acid hydratase in catechol pathway
LKICRFGEGRIGVVVGGTVHDVTDECDLARPPLTRARGDALIASLDQLRPRLEAACQSAPRYDLDSVPLLAPVAQPPRVIAVRTNYGSGTAESDPDLFLKAATSVVGPSEGITLKFPERRTDHEVELVAVVGRECEAAGPATALACIAGCCVGIDVTLRGDEDRGLRKSLDGHTVLGPWLTTADEAGDTTSLGLWLNVNGSRRQDGNTAQMLHKIAAIVSCASRYFRLLPGDVIMTGTPAGVGPLQPGDTVECGVEGLGNMRVAVHGPLGNRFVQR